MNRVRVDALIRAAACVCGLLIIGGCATPPLALTPDDPGGERLVRVVDSAEAHALLIEILAGAPERFGVWSSSGSAIPDQPALNAIGRDVSMDYAALTFAQALYADSDSRPVQQAYEQALQDGPERSEEMLLRPGGFPYTILFAPGWLYRSHPKSGADFAAQRAELDRLGIANRLIPTAQSGSVNNNAETIAAAVRDAASRDETVILVSASKAGADAAFALTQMLAPAEVSHVAAWINAGGALEGTPLADMGLRAPISWIVRTYFGIAGWSLDGVRSMRTETSSVRFDEARMPRSIAVINLVAIPMSGTVGREVKGGYWAMRRRGPTDGVVPLAQAVWPGGYNVPALGSDHLLSEFGEREHGTALLRTVDFAIRHHATEPPLTTCYAPGNDDVRWKEPGEAIYDLSCHHQFIDSLAASPDI